MLFFDFHVDENPELVLEAERLGYAGIVLFRAGDGHGELDFDGLNQEHSINVYKGISITARNPEDMRQKVKKSREKADVIMVRGGDQKINRAACEDPRVDILSKPYFKRRDCGINHVMAKKAAQNGVTIELNIKYLAKTSSYLHYKVLSHFREILKLKRKYTFPVIITSGAESIYDLHTPHDIVALAGCFGMDCGEAEDSLSETPQEIIEKTSTRNRIIVDGVKLIE